MSLFYCAVLLLIIIFMCLVGCDIYKVTHKVEGYGIKHHIEIIKAEKNDTTRIP